MQSPPAEWSLALGYLAALDYLRDHGEPDGDTLSEVLRSVFRVHDRRGRLVLAASLTGAGIALYRHLAKPT